MQIRFRRRGAQTYVYLVQKARRDGKAVNVTEMYLGTQDEVARRLTDPEPGARGLEFLPYPFGTAAAFLTADEELGFSRVVQELTGSRATAWSRLAFIAGRAHEPVSKNGMTDGANHSLFRFVRGRPNLSSRSYPEHMDRLTEDVVEQITLRLGEELGSKGYRPSLVFFDPTNYLDGATARGGRPGPSAPQARACQGRESPGEARGARHRRDGRAPAGLPSGVSRERERREAVPGGRGDDGHPAREVRGSGGRPHVRL